MIAVVLSLVKLSAPGPVLAAMGATSDCPMSMFTAVADSVSVCAALSMTSE